MPVMKEPELLKHWEYLYIRSVGCVGILKDWLVRALNESYENGEKTVSQKTLEGCALSVYQCERIAAEMIAGEERLKENPVGDSRRLSQMLGLAERVKGDKASVGLGTTNKSEKPPEANVQLKRRIGQRKPKRDEVP
jgi:hypothetical protein